MMNSNPQLKNVTFNPFDEPSMEPLSGFRSDPDFEIPLKYRQLEPAEVIPRLLAPSVLRLAKGRKIVLCASQTLLEAAQLMRQFGVGVLPVLAGEQAIGILTDRDIVLRSVIQEKPTAQTTVREAMTTPAFTCFADEEVLDAVDLMLETQVHQLLVQSRGGRFWGVLSLSDCEAALQAFADPTCNALKAPPSHCAPLPIHGTFQKSCF